MRGCALKDATDGDHASDLAGTDKRAGHHWHLPRTRDLGHHDLGAKAFQGFDRAIEQSLGHQFVPLGRHHHHFQAGQIGRAFDLHLPEYGAYNLSVSERLQEWAAHCIRCGFCLEACPTFVLTGDETKSPRGRIALAMAADAGEMPWSETREALDTCLGCRACESACPSAVPYGAILEEARTHLPPTLAQKTFLRVLTHPQASIKLVDAASFAPSRRVPAVPGLAHGKPQADAPQRQPEPHWSPLPIGNLPPVTEEVYLLRGCLAGSLFPTTLAAVTRLLRRVGVQVRHTADACCGSMMAHAGQAAEAEAKLNHLKSTMPDGLRVVTFTAGCGSHLKETWRSIDITEILLEKGLAQQLKSANGVSGLSVTYHDACHLAHGQKVKSAPRELLGAVPGLRLIELKESDMCCGSAGTYNVFQPTMARQLLERKWENIASTGAHIVAQGNAGCHSWIAQAARERGSQIRIMHTAEVLESAFSGLP